jgi:hypothetical protein
MNHSQSCDHTHFWKGWEVYKASQWVTFNGRSFDLPLMELATPIWHWDRVMVQKTWLSFTVDIAWILIWI